MRLAVLLIWQRPEGLEPSGRYLCENIRESNFVKGTGFVIE